MKRAIIALVLAAALLLSVVGCQVYNPANNSTLYTAMRTEGATSWEDYSKKFEDADAEGKYEILKEYETFRKLHKSQKAWDEAITAYEEAEAKVVTAEKEFADAKEALDKAAEAALDDAEKAANAAKTTLENAEKAMKEARKAVLYTVDDLKALWDKEYDVLWDFNGKL